LTAREARALPQIAVRRRCDFFPDNIFAGRKVKIVKRKRHKTTLREELEDLNDYLDLTEARVRAAGKPRPHPR